MDPTTFGKSAFNPGKVPGDIISLAYALPSQELDGADFSTNSNIEDFLRQYAKSHGLDTQEAAYLAWAPMGYYQIEAWKSKVYGTTAEIKSAAIASKRATKEKTPEVVATPKASKIATRAPGEAARGAARATPQVATRGAARATPQAATISTAGLSTVASEVVSAVIPSWVAPVGALVGLVIVGGGIWLAVRR